MPDAISVTVGAFEPRRHSSWAVSLQDTSSSIRHWAANSFVSFIPHSAAMLAYPTHDSPLFGMFGVVLIGKAFRIDYTASPLGLGWPGAVPKYSRWNL